MNPKEFVRRRKRLMDVVNEGGIAILPAAPVRMRNRDVEFPYRPDSDFYYLTGFPEPDAVAVLIPGRPQGEYVLFCRERDPQLEQWTGYRAGLEGACNIYGADDAFLIADLDDIQVDDPYLEHLFALLPEGRRRELDLATLRQGARVHALGDDGEPVGSWSLWEWLEAEVEHEGSTYLLSGGALWLVRPEYRDDLDAFLSRLEAWPRYPLPDSLPGEVEGDYNTRAADESDGRLLSLDAKTVRMPSNPDPIEVCDLLSDHGELIHVKRKLRSSSLSHLFGQGAVSGELLLDPEFRSVAAERARKEQEEAGLGTDFAATLPGTDGDGRRRVVVYAVIADWNGRSLVEAVPFFSRVNLRNHVERLRALGYDVYFNPVPVLQAAVAKKGRQPQAPPEAVPKGA